MSTVWIYVDTTKDVGDRDHLKVFADEAAAEAWFTDHDPEGVAFGYPVTPFSAQRERTGTLGRLATRRQLRTQKQGPFPAIALSHFIFLSTCSKPAQFATGRDTDVSKWFGSAFSTRSCAT